MNFDYAITEPFLRYHEFQVSFDRNIRVAYGGLQMLRTGAKLEHKGDVALVEVPAGDEPWGKPRLWKNVPVLVSHSARFLSHMGAVRVLSAFEDFLIATKAEYDRYTGIAVGAPVPESDDAESLGFSSLCQQLGWNQAAIAPLLPLIEYFTLIRNCIVHRNGRASRALVRYAESEKLATSISAANSGRMRRLPTLPSLATNADIPLLPRHAVLAAIVCRWLAAFANGQLIQHFGESGMAYMAAHHGLLAPETSVLMKAKTPVVMMNRLLCERYRVRQVDPVHVVANLKQLGCWKKCCTRFETLRAAHDF